MKSFPLVRLLVVVAIGLVAGPGRALAQSQDDVTVAFLYNFARFVEWPPTAFSGHDAPVVVGFVGRPALADKFAQAVQGKNANGRELSVRKLDNGEGTDGCHIVFIGDAAQVPSTLAALKGKAVLTVGQGEEFLSAGGMIGFSRDGPRLVFDINAPAIKAAALVAADKLSKAARSTKGG